MIIKTVERSKLNPAPYNPRKDLTPEDPAYKKLKKSIIEFDYIDPIIWNIQTGNIVGGHQRLKILDELNHSKKNGDYKLQVSVVDLTPHKEKVLNIALNKHSGEWDYPKLKDLIVEIDTGEIDIEITGFDQEELERLFGELVYDLDAEWKNMPAFDQEDITSFRSVIVHFKNNDDVKEFFKLINQNDTGKTKSIWFPKQDQDNSIDYAYES